MAPYPLADKAGYCSHQKPDSYALPYIGQNLGIGKPCLIVDGDSFFSYPALPERHNRRFPVIRWPMRSNRANFLMSIRIFVASMVPLFSTYQSRRLLIRETFQAHGLEGSPHG